MREVVQVFKRNWISCKPASSVILPSTRLFGVGLTTTSLPSISRRDLLNCSVENLYVPDTGA